MDRNPYAAPQTSVVDPIESGNEALLEKPLTRPIGRGVAWISSSFELFKRSPGLWIILIIIYIVLAIAVQMVPLLGPLFGAVIYPVFAAFSALLLDGQRRTGRTNEQDALDLLFKRMPNILLLGLITTLATLGISLLVMIPLLGGETFAALYGFGTFEPNLETLQKIVLASLIVLALVLPISMAAWFASTLLALHPITVVESLRRSFAACLRNILPFLLYGIVMLVLLIVATIPLLLGWLVVGPMFLISIYVAYRDIFFESTERFG